MTVAEMMADVNDAWQGDTDAAAEDTPTWDYLLRIANRKIRNWAKDKNQSWRSLFDVVTVGTLSTRTTYDLDETVHKLADFGYVYNTDDELAGSVSVIKPTARKVYGGETVIYQTGNTTKTLNISPSVPTTWIGYKLKAGVYTIPEALTGAGDDIPVDDPDWLVLAVAAEAARNDPAKDDQYGNLQGQANDLYRTMILNNAQLPFNQSNGVPVQGFINPGENSEGAFA